MKGYIILIQAISNLRKIYGMKEELLSKSIYYCFVLGAVLTSIQFLQNMGSQMVGEWISDPNSDWMIQPQDYVTLHLAYSISQAQSLWLGDLYFLLFSIGLLITFFLEMKHKPGFGLRIHSIIGVIISVVGVITFGRSKFLRIEISFLIFLFLKVCLWQCSSTLRSMEE